MDDKKIVCYECIFSEHKLHNIVKIEEAIEYYKNNLKKKKTEIEVSISKVKKEQTKFDEEYKKKSIEFEEKKEIFQRDLKKILELESTQNLKDLMEFSGFEDMKILFENVYCFGKNSYGELGIKKEGYNIYRPTKMEFFKDTKIQALASGYEHTIVLTGN